MYAARRLYVKRWDFQPAEECYSVQVVRGGKPVPGIKSERITHIEEEVMYWRKANHIHAWFVENVQNGKDDCGNYRVSWDKLRELLSVCKEVLKASKLVGGMVSNGTMYNKKHPDGMTLREPGKVVEDTSTAEELLPTRDGFFFGSGEYNEYYLDDVRSTHDWVVSMLADHAAGVPGDIYYSSSW